MFPETRLRERALRDLRARIFERDEYKCRSCGRQLTRFTATLDYIKPAAEGGEESEGNLLTVCVDCNAQERIKPR